MFRKIAIVVLYLVHLFFMFAYLIVAACYFAIELGASTRYFGQKNASEIMNYYWFDHIINITFSLAMLLGIHFLWKRKDYAVHCYFFGFFIYFASGFASSIYFAGISEAFIFTWLDLLRFTVVVAMARLVYVLAKQQPTEDIAFARRTINS